MKIKGLTDTGKTRENNQDYLYIDPDFKWCVIADGMGGHNGGEIASEMTVEIIKTAMDNISGDIEDGIRSAIVSANKAVYKKSLSDNELIGMGTTTVLCYLSEGKAIFAHVGDSRAYHISDTGISQITLDHSIVQQLVECGTITKEQARYHPQKNLITRAVGTEPSIEIDINNVSYKKGDYFLMCTDGLTSLVEDKYILKIVNENDLDTATQVLVSLANENGGKDNITVVLIQL